MTIQIFQQLFCCKDMLWGFYSDGQYLYIMTKIPGLWLKADKLISNVRVRQICGKCSDVFSVYVNKLDASNLLKGGIRRVHVTKSNVKVVVDDYYLPLCECFELDDVTSFNTFRKKELYIDYVGQQNIHKIWTALIKKGS